MKKILTTAVVLLVLNSLTMAQAVKKDAVKATETNLKVVAAKSAAAPAAKVVPITKTVAATKTAEVAKPAATTVVVKKDGTPDKRYNNAPKSTVPVKKDGSPDMRYKKNKTN